jgi:hypothetical protein
MCAGRGHIVEEALGIALAEFLTIWGIIGVFAELQDELPLLVFGSSFRCAGPGRERHRILDHGHA